MSFREAASASDLDKDTVQRIWKRFLEYCEESMESLLKDFNIKLEDLIMLLYKRIQKR
jgi:chorismate mutase